VFPPYCPERTFVLTGPQIRIGRRSTSRGTAPEIDLSEPPADPGVSHLHAVLLAQPDGGWALVDPGSTNGTWINDATDPLTINVAVPLQVGDRIHLGAWTTIMFATADPPV
jgi:pSer/pThr/pTyr-binding forkhead associated (FHA) protein